jgi:MYXO-CTERM domain-containing protein
MSPNRTSLQIVVLAVAGLLCAGCSDENGSPGNQAVQDRPVSEHTQSPSAVQNAPDSADSDWQQTGPRRIADGQYRIRQVDGGVEFRASNQAHRLRARFGPRDVRVTGHDDDRTFSLGLARWGRPGKLAATAAGELARGGCADQAFVDAQGTCIRRVEIRRDGITEWWHNRPDGLEQGFTIDRRPAGAGPVIVEMAVEGASVEIDEDGQAADFTGDSGWTLRYAKLRAWDARGTTLSARMVSTPGGLAVQVDDTGAHYPITIDPLLTSPAWTAEGDHNLALFGQSVSSAGDVNADGIDDVIVGADGYDNGQAGEGRAFVYLGSAGGLAASPAWTAESDQTDARFGASVSRAEDVNGDGFDDVIVGAHLYDNGQTDEGGAFVYHGSASGLATSPAWTAEGDQIDATFGRSVSSAGDVNGDGFGDVIVGADGYGNGQAGEGRAFMYLGSAAGLSTSPAWTAEGDQIDAFFGRAVSSAGDVNADGFDDVIVGAHGYDNGQDTEGRAFMYLGSAGGLATSAAWTAEGDQTFARFGQAVSSAGDVNADGFGDVIVGAPGYTNGQAGEGRAFVYLGSAGGLATSPAWTAEGDRAFVRFGQSVRSAGDVNADGFGDVIASAPEYDNGPGDEGRAFVYLGSASGLATSAAWTAEGGQTGTYFGASVSSAGDVNADGFDDFIVGAPQYAGVGWAFVYYVNVGAANQPPSAVDDSATTDENTPVTVDVLANDNDPDGDTLTVTIGGAPTSGTAVVNADDTITYTPSTNFSGTDSLAYTVNDGTGGSDSATLDLTVNAASPCQGLQCSDDQACYAGTCFETCTGDDDCSNPNDVCYDQRCAADPCDGVQCSDDQACYAGTCFETCTGDDDCSNPNDVCYDQRCAADPCDGVQCSADQACYAGTCFETCTGDDDCSNPDDVCYDQRCTADPCDGVQCSDDQACYAGTCFETCSGDDDCSNPDDVCYDQRCAADPCDGVQCSADQACYAGTCFETCTGDDDCSNPDDVCFDQRCAADPCDGVQCGADQACYSGTCFETCTDDADCSKPNEACYDQRCTTDPCDGVQCGADQVCIEGVCAGEGQNLHVTGGGVSCATSPVGPHHRSILPWGLLAALFAAAGWRRRVNERI